MVRRKNHAWVVKLSLSLLILAGLVVNSGQVVLANSTSSQINAEICNGTEPNPTIVVNPISNSTVYAQNVSLQFQTKFVHKLVTKRGVEVLATSSPEFSDNQTFVQNITLNEGLNQFVFEINGGCPRDDSTQNYSLNYDPYAATLNKLVTNNRSPKISGTVNSPDTKIEVEIEGNTYLATNNGDDTWSLPAGTIEPELADGVYDVKITTKDASDNVVYEHLFEGYLTVDNLAPAVAIETVKTDQRSPQITGTVDDPDAKIEVVINGKIYPAINNGDGTWTLPAGTIEPELASGNYEIEVTATDSAGNQTVVKANLKVDAKGEIGFILAPDTGYLRVGNFNLPSWAIYLTLIGLGVIIAKVRKAEADNKIF